MRAKDAIVYLMNLPEDEPVFVLRAQDATAGANIVTWIAIAQANNVPEAKLEEARACHRDFLAWPQKKVPD